MKKNISYFILCLVLLSCKVEDTIQIPDTTTADGYRVSEYLTESEVQKIVVDAPASIKNPAKTISTSTYILLEESNKGIHILPYQKQGKPVAFLSIPLIEDFSLLENVLVETIIKNNKEEKIYGDVLIANNGKNLVSFDLRNISTLLNIGYTEAKKAGLELKPLALQKNVFRFYNLPPAKKVFFECPDTTRYALEWEKILIDPKKAKCFN